MKHSSTSSLISSLMFASTLAIPAASDDAIGIGEAPQKQIEVQGPRQETICALQLFARAYTPKSKDGWFDKHTLSSKAL